MLRSARWPTRPGLKICKGLDQLLPRIHHEWPVCGNGITERFARQHQHLRPLRTCRQPYLLPGAGKYREVVHRHLVLPIHDDAPLGDKHGDGPVCGPRERERPSRMQGDSPQVHRAVGGRRSTCSGKFPGDDRDGTRIAAERDDRDVRRVKGLVVRGRHLLRGRQVDPQLDHVEIAARTGELRLVVLLVQHAGARGHPLDPALADDPAAAGAVVVGDAPAESHCHRLKSAVRVHAHPARPLRRGEDVARIVIQHDERIQPLHLEARPAGDEGVHAESIPHEMRLSWRDDALERFYVHAAKVSTNLKAAYEPTTHLR